jgi:uncharacterized protein (DUF4415 family)
VRKKTKADSGDAAGKKAGQHGRNSRLRTAAKEWAAPDEKMYKPVKKPVTLRLDADILSWFKVQGRGYQTRINRALRGVMMKERK